MNRRLHVVSLPHTQTTRRFLHCAYTQKVLKFCDMMSRGYEVILYSGDENEAACSEHVPLFTEEDRELAFGTWDENGLFGNLDWNPDQPYWRRMNERATLEISARAQREDFLCLVAGWSQAPIAALMPDLLPVEFAVGYEGIHLPHRVFESYAWMHHVYGLKGIKDGVAYDAVIPNFFDPQDFSLAKGRRKGEHLLFMGRLVQRKGPHVAAAIAARTGRKLVVAGPGAVAGTPIGTVDKIVAPEVEIAGCDLEYAGPVGLEDRARLMGEAAAVVVPTQYIEPFGGVAVEAMFAGTPVVATDWGAFTETVTRDVGRRFRTLAEGARAVEEAVELESGQHIRDHAYWRYSLAAVYPHFDAHFERLSGLWGEGWYA